MNFEAILDILFPPECLGCGKGLINGTLCVPCKNTIGGPPAIAIKNMDNNDGRGECYFLGAAGRYQNHVLKTLIHALKFGGIRGAATPLAEILAHHAETVALPLQTFTVMPIPLSKMRMRERGSTSRHSSPNDLRACDSCRSKRTRSCERNTGSRKAERNRLRNGAKIFAAALPSKASVVAFVKTSSSWMM